MSLSFFIFTRFIKSNRNSRFLNLISTISILGISLGVATLIIALSIISGFEKTLTNKIIELDSHIKIFSISHKIQVEFDEVNTKLKNLTNDAEYISPYLSSIVIISRKGRSDGITLKGIENPFYIEKIKSNIIEGEFIPEKKYQIIIGKSFARKMFLKVGDKVSLISLDNYSTDNQFPNIELFTISAVYESGITNYDDIIAFTDLKSAQEFLSNNRNLINGIDIKLKNLNNVFQITSEIRDKLKYPLYAQNIFEMHRNIFTWIDLQKKPIPIALSLIIIVAVFNIISTLFLMVIERTSSIGILKALGLKRRQIISLFLLQGLQITLYGILLGNLLAILLMIIQQEFNVIKVPSSIYLVTNVPFDFSIYIFALVSISTILIAIISSLIPSWVSGKINPIKAIKFQ